MSTNWHMKFLAGVDAVVVEAEFIERIRGKVAANDDISWTSARDQQNAWDLRNLLAAYDRQAKTVATLWADLEKLKAQESKP